jgi:ubiquinone/menaquinone biosynthesis C-methylase UbiE
MINYEAEKQINNKKLESNRKKLQLFYEKLAYEGNHDSALYTRPTGIERRLQIVKILNLGKKDVILDIGCGDGSISEIFLKNIKLAIGVDISKTRLRRAKNKGLKVILINDASEIPLKSNSVDKAICTEVLEHVLQPGKVLGEINRILKKGGILVLTAPLNEPLRNTLLDVPLKDVKNLSYNKLKEKYGLRDAHLWPFSQKNLIDYLKVNGFKIDDVSYTYEYIP